MKQSLVQTWSKGNGKQTQANKLQALWNRAQIDALQAQVEKQTETNIV